MKKEIERREFLQLSAAGGALCLGGAGLSAFAENSKASRHISPGCRGRKVQVARMDVTGKSNYTDEYFIWFAPVPRFLHCPYGAPRIAKVIDKGFVAFADKITVMETVNGINTAVSIFEKVGFIKPIKYIIVKYSSIGI